MVVTSVIKNKLQHLLKVVRGGPFIKKWKKNPNVEFQKLLDQKYGEFKVIDKFMRFQKNSVVLDYGIGLGLIAKHICKNVKKVYGWDANNNMLDFCRENYKEISNLILLNRGVSVSVKNLSVTHIVANNVIGEYYSLDKLTKLLKKFHNILCEKGFLWFDFYNKEFKIESSKRCHQAEWLLTIQEQEKFFYNMYYYNIKELREIINKNGFKILLLDHKRCHGKALIQKVS